jgi:hypothetical protein
MTLRPFGAYYIFAVLVIIFAILGVAGIIPFTAPWVFGMIAVGALALAF